ncbi:uroporphyrinogen-III synthase [Celeribacter arenosi]|uniref:Uroporphyrinogen-III synthase n=1 Tax=Celeribacter arenosi TaxID=792649 RepID=A0ABP7JY25_9RHOB
MARLYEMEWPNLDVIVAPAMKIVTLSGDFPEHGYEATLLTSRSAVAAARQHFPDIAAYCVGDATAQEARDAGLSAVSAAGAAPDLIGLILKDGLKKVVHLRGAHSRGEIAQKLTSAGVQTDSIVVYDQVERAWKDKEIERIENTHRLIVPVFSPRSSALIGSRLASYRGKITLIAISKAARDEWSGPKPKHIEIAEKPDAPAMKAAIASQLA